VATRQPSLIVVVGCNAYLHLRALRQRPQWFAGVARLPAGGLERAVRSTVAQWRHAAQVRWCCAVAVRCLVTGLSLLIKASHVARM
jgi:hypothetical protein